MSKRSKKAKKVLAQVELAEHLESLGFHQATSAYRSDLCAHGKPVDLIVEFSKKGRFRRVFNPADGYTKPGRWYMRIYPDVLTPELISSLVQPKEGDL